MNTQVMRPGILVALKTNVNGGMSYSRNIVESSEDDKVMKWETTRYMDDPEERKLAGETAGKASRLISKLCVRTTFGLLCPTEREAELDEAVTEMRAVVGAWNETARYSFIHCSAIKGRIADNDEEAIRAIVQEARELLDRMDKGLDESDVKLIRDAANKAKKLSEMMVPGTGDQIDDALAAARRAARAIVKQAESTNQRVAAAIVSAEREAFDAARVRFIETSDEVIDSLPSVDLQRAASIELDDDVAEVG